MNEDSDRESLSSNSSRSSYRSSAHKIRDEEEGEQRREVPVDISPMASSPHSTDELIPLRNRGSRAITSSSESWQLSLDDFKSKMRSDDEMKLLRGRKQKDTKKYYESQRDLVQSYEDAFYDKKKDEEQIKSETRGATIAIYGSFAVNVMLACVKVYAAIVSGSLAIIASAVDSFLDLLSGSIIFVTTKALKNTNVYKFPAGKTRLEPIGIIVFAACMATATLQLLVNGIQILLSGKTEVDITTPTLVIVGITVSSKLILFLYCRLQKHSPSALAYAQDHFNDILTNSVGLGSALLAFYYPKCWFMDAVGGILMGLYIMVTWCRNGYEQVQIVSGKTADADFISKVTFLCWNHHPAIKAIDTVRAFHIANGFSVEIDIVLDADMPLREAHDIGESLQERLEGWEDVERCFVHLDYETQHKPEHKWVGGRKRSPSAAVNVEE